MSLAIISATNPIKYHTANICLCVILSSGIARATITANHHHKRIRNSTPFVVYCSALNIILYHIFMILAIVPRIPAMMSVSIKLVFIRYKR